MRAGRCFARRRRLVIAISLPGLALLIAGDMQNGFDRTLTLLVSGGGFLTAAPLACLRAPLSRAVTERSAWRAVAARMRGGDLRA